MKKRIIGILVCILLIATALPAVGTMNDNKTIRATIQQPVPDLTCEGSLTWVDIPPGDPVDGSFIVENIGEPSSLLDWEIDDWPIWMVPVPGYPLFDPDYGTGLLPGTPVTVDVKFKAPIDPCSTFTGVIMIINTNNPADWCTIDISLTTPVNQQIDMHPLFQRILERFPNAFPILRQLLGL